MRPPRGGPITYPKRGVTTGCLQAQETRCQPSRHPGRHCRMLWLGFGTVMRPICLTYQNTREDHRFLGTGGRSRPLVSHSRALPPLYRTQRNFHANPVQVGLRAARPAAQTRAGCERRERERERERERGCRRREGKGRLGAGGGGRLILCGLCARIKRFFA